MTRGIGNYAAADSFMLKVKINRNMILRVTFNLLSFVLTIGA
jgi:hypothetical protein